ncbi:MAG: sulfatase-like hydrolase/transferase, partial [Planctomycetota bacterium]
MTDFIAGGEFPYEKLKQLKWQKYLPLEETTIAEVFKTAGYATASFGKWHLSIAKKPPESEPYNPDKQGFDESIITYKPKSNQDPEKDAHNVETITKKSLEFLEKNKDRPFFLYVTHNTIHNPLLGKSKLVEKYRNKPGSDLPQNNPVVGAMIEEMDNSAGRLLKKLEELEIADKTIVVFFSDNGGLESAAKQTPLRSGKANLYEGGIREPLIVRWPGVVEPGSICSEPVISVDFFPTFLGILGLENKAKKPVDGVSLVPLLKQTGSLNRRAIYWHYPHYHSSSIGPCGAVRKDDYKLIEWFDETICGP